MKLHAIHCLFLQLIFQLSSCTHLRVIPGASLELPCLSIQPGFPIGDTIIWKFNGKIISTQSPGSATVQGDGLYVSISPVTAASAGEYVCSVKNTNMEITRGYTILVDALNTYAITVIEGSTLYLPCHFSSTSQVEANALWFREMDIGRIQLNVGDGSSDGNDRIEQLYPMEHDQTIVLRNTMMEDAGFYQCESAEGERLSTMLVVVQAPPTPPPHSCENFATAWEPCQNERSRTGEPLLQESIATFSMKLYSYLRESQPLSNLLFSPIGIHGILSHLLLGARGDTRRALETALAVPHDFHCVHFHMKKLRENLAGSLQMASQIYYNPQMNLSESFTNQSIEFYDAAPTRLLETSEGNTQMINSWVANNTNNKIRHLFDSVAPSTQMILINAVYFSGQWKVDYELKTNKRYFTKLNGDMVKVPVLYHQKYLTVMAFIAALKAQVARFALTGDSSLYILLPYSNTASDLEQLETKMTDAAVRQMVDKMKASSPEHAEVTLPKIKLDVQSDMHILIKKLGLSSLFEGANLCGLYTEEKLVLNDARHRTFIALTERGVEAGAVTSISFSRTFAFFSAMRPFIMLLWSDQANVPLFIGRVMEP